jgi:hypothetical protein
MEQDTMAQSHIAAENHSAQSVGAARQTPKKLHSSDLRASARTPPQSRPPVSRDGLETLRSSDC